MYNSTVIFAALSIEDSSSTFSRVVFSDHNRAQDAGGTITELGFSCNCHPHKLAARHT